MTAEIPDIASDADIVAAFAALPTIADTFLEADRHVDLVRCAQYFGQDFGSPIDPARPQRIAPEISLRTFSGLIYDVSTFDWKAAIAPESTRAFAAAVPSGATDDVAAGALVFEAQRAAATLAVIHHPSRIEASVRFDSNGFSQPPRKFLRPMSGGVALASAHQRAEVLHNPAAALRCGAFDGFGALGVRAIAARFNCGQSELVDVEVDPVCDLLRIAVRRIRLWTEGWRLQHGS